MPAHGLALVVAASLAALLPDPNPPPDAKTPDVLIKQAEAREALHDPAGAAAIWQAIVTRFPGDRQIAEVRHKLAVCLLKSRQPDQAIAQCRLLLSARPPCRHADEVQLVLGESLNDSASRVAGADAKAAASRFAEARSIFEARLRAGSDATVRALTLYHLGIARDGLRERESAGGAYDQFLREFAGHNQAPEVRLRRALIWLERREPSKAEPLLREASGASSFEHADAACLKLAECLAIQGKYEAAAQEAASLETRFAKSSRITSALARAAACFAAAGKPQECRKALDRLPVGPAKEDAVAEVARLTAQADPTFAEEVASTLLEGQPLVPRPALLRFWRAVARIKKGSHEQALGDMEAALAAKLPADRELDARRQIPGLLLRLGRHRDALAAYDQFLKLYPKDPNLGLALFERAQAIEAVRPGEAAAAFERVGLEAPESPMAAEAWLRAGEHHLEAKAPAEASRCLATAIPRLTDAPQRAFARSRLGECEIALGRLKEAAASFDLAAAESSDRELTAASLYLGGVARQRSADLAGALERYRKVIEADAGYVAEALVGAGDACLGLGRSDEAETHFGRCLDRSSGQPQAQEARLGLGRVLMARGQWREARKRLEALVGEGSGSMAEARAQFHLAEALDRLGKPREAAYAFLDVAAYEPGDLAAPDESVRLAALALLRSAQAFDALGDEARARSPYARLAAPPYAELEEGKAAADWLRRHPTR